jgi:hypothetical protein
VAEKVRMLFKDRGVAVAGAMGLAVLVCTLESLFASRRTRG